jgi:hypothetical protein
MLRVSHRIYFYPECHYAACRYDECHAANFLPYSRFYYSRKKFKDRFFYP